MHPLYLARPALAIDPTVTQAALAQDATAQRIMARGTQPEPGARIGVRLNLNVLKSTGKAVQTLHQGNRGEGYQHNRGFFQGEVLGYAEAVTLRDAYFNVHQQGRQRIAAGEHNKFPMASIDGDLQAIETQANLDGVEVRFNPKQTHLFIDADNRAIRYAEEVTIVGHRAYARGRIEYHTALTAPLPAGDAPSVARVDPAPAWVASAAQEEAELDPVMVPRARRKLR